MYVYIYMHGDSESYPRPFSIWTRGWPTSLEVVYLYIYIYIYMCVYKSVHLHLVTLRNMGMAISTWKLWLV
jgi:hypothetical protein